MDFDEGSDAGVLPEEENSTGPKIELDAVTKVNFAFSQNDVPVLRKLEVKNRHPEDALTDIRLLLSSEPPMFRKKIWTIDRLAPDETVEITDLKLVLDPALLGGLTEAETGLLTLQLEIEGEVLLTEQRQVSLLARDEWGGFADMAEIIAAYVAPNEALVAQILKDAAKLLGATGQDRSLDGYQTKDPGRAWMLAGAIWSSMTGLGLDYAVPPRSFEVQGQKIRGPGRIKEEGLATCLDTSLLLAAAFEAAGLNPVVFFADGHAWAGVWIKDRDFGVPTQTDVVQVRKDVHARELIPIETTFATKRPAVGFEQAVDAGKRRLSEEQEADFIMAVDIARCRAGRIHPLASHDQATSSEPSSDLIAPAALPKPIDFGQLPGDIVDEKPQTPLGRIERWQRKLLDLSLRNRLLNFKPTAKTLPFRVADVGQLEDLLSEGEVFRGYPLRDNDLLQGRTFQPGEKSAIEEDIQRDVFGRKQLVVDLTKVEMNKRFLSLHRQTKSDMQEGGTNTLFIAAGFLRWKRSATDTQTYRAPLLLLPVRLERRAAQSVFKIRQHEDDAVINSTLLELLKRDFSLTIPELAGELPRDDSGIDVPRIFESVRRHVREIEGFEVVEDVALSTFSFAKYLMWKDLVDRTDQLRENSLVAHLVDNPDRVFEGGDAPTIAPHEVDTKTDPASLFLPLPADSSQMAAVATASTGKDFVLVGPPGTGKSQTIANIIAQCLADGKTVLFVAEKAAALDVVQRRLTAHGLDEACLELHSNKTDRKRVLSQLGKSWDRSAGLLQEDWIKVTSELKVTRAQLNAYVADLHKIGTQGFSIFDAIGTASRSLPTVDLAFDNKDVHDAKSYEDLVEVCRELTRVFDVVGEVSGLSLITAQDWSFGWESALIPQLSALRDRLEELRHASQSVNDVLGLGPDKDVSPDRQAAIRGLRFRLDSAVDLSEVPDLPEPELRKAMRDLAQVLSEIETQKSQLSAEFDLDSLEMIPLEALDQDWREALAKVWPASKLAISKVRKKLQSYALAGKVDPARDIMALRKLKTTFSGLDQNVLRSLHKSSKVGTDLTPLKSCIGNALEFRKFERESLKKHCNDPQVFGGAMAELCGVSRGEVRNALHHWFQTEEAFFAAWADVTTDDLKLNQTDTLKQSEDRLTQLLENRDRLNDWAKWNQVKTRAINRGLGSLVEQVEAGTLEAPADAVFEASYAAWWLPLALDEAPYLRQFAHWEHEQLIRKFSELDEKAATLAPREIMRRIKHGLPGREGVPRDSELGVLRHQLALQRPNMSTRSLLAAMPKTFGKLAPCVLMSPLSVAQYLPAGQPAFDVVIFDEASQISTWDAVGAIARGRQAIIVGDPKQLPPTNFFGRSDDDGESDDPLPMDQLDMPSILDEVSVAGISTRYLTWHYRSRDESLIAFSNQNYYGGELITFPAPSSGESAVRHHPVNGTYARGAGQSNDAEARAIAAFVCERLTDWLDVEESERQTLGVITFNIQQQTLIQNHLDRVRRDDPRLEWFFSEDREEPVIVKNLENIQGDERDVMLFSITFGPDAAGKLTMNFGALNGDGGERRLNVAVTRARAEMHIFASVFSEQIDLTRARGRGVRDLKAFLDYAERGPVALAAQDKGSLGPAESPFEQAVADALASKGWEVRTQIGVSGFRVDMVVVHPDHAGTYLSGIECDGATYHSSASARDRDMTRQAVLEGLGWKILRIWSTEWFRNSKTVLDRIHDDLKAILELDRERRQEAERIRAERAAKEQAEADASEPETVLMIEGPDREPSEPIDRGSEETSEPALDLQEPDPVAEPSLLQLVASNADLSGSHAGADLIPDPDRFFDAAYLPQLEKMVSEIIRDSAPLPLPSLAKQVSKAHGWQRTGNRIAPRVTSALGDAVTEEIFDETFVWPATGPRERVAPKPLAGRSVREVHPAEIASTIDKYARGFELSEDRLLDLARHLGINRLSASARSYLEDCFIWRERSVED